jgi:hypothetical protein
VPGAASNISESLAGEILAGYQTSACRDFINALAGSRRAFAHAQICPGAGNVKDPAFGDYTQWQIEYCRPGSWKGDSVAYAASAFPGAEFTRWRLPGQIAEKYHYPQLTRHDKRKILGLNSARHYGLLGRETRGAGTPGGPYRHGDLANYQNYVQPGSSIDTVLQGAGYPAPMQKVSLIPDDNFTKLKAMRTESGAGRSNTRFGWTRTV